MGEIDQISAALGRLIEAEDAHQVQRDRLLDKVDVIMQNISDLKSSIAVISKILDQHNTRISLVENQLSSVLISKAKMGAALSVVAALGAGAYEGAGKITEIFARLWG
jgi:hypothetical protein